jgi:hypothetical protein
MELEINQSDLSKLKTDLNKLDTAVENSTQDLLDSALALIKNDARTFVLSGEYLESWQLRRAMTGSVNAKDFLLENDSGHGGYVEVGVDSRPTYRAHHVVENAFDFLFGNFDVILR